MKKNTRPPYFSGFVWSINAKLDLYKGENIDNKNNQGKEYFLLTTRLQQDPLESLILIIRQKNGYNRNPTCRTFRNSISNI